MVPSGLVQADDRIDRRGHPSGARTHPPQSPRSVHSRPVFANGLGVPNQSHIDEAILWLAKARSANPRLLNVRPFLASAYALKGETERGVAELGEARRLKDNGSFSSISRIARGYW